MRDMGRLEEIELIKKDPIKYPPDDESDYVHFIDKDHFNWLIDTVKEQQKTIDQLADTAGRLNQYLQKYPGGWGRYVTDVAIDVMEKQQKEIEDWKELFFLLKSDFEKLENFQTYDWKIKARQMDLEV